MEHIARFLFLHQISDALTTNNKPETFTIDQQNLPPIPHEIVIDKQGQDYKSTQMCEAYPNLLLCKYPAPTVPCIQGALLLVE